MWEGQQLKNSHSAPFKVHILHVGSMNNKGAEILLKSDIGVLRRMTKNASITVSTSDPEGVKRLDMPFDGILPHVVDIPYEQADLMARKRGYSRRGLEYKILSLVCMARMFFQVFLCVLSSSLVRCGVKKSYRSAVFRRMRESDLVISCSDENFKEGTLAFRQNAYWLLTWWSVIAARALAVLTAKFYGKKVVMLPNSVGPFRTFIGLQISRLALRSCDLILVRESDSYKILDEIKVRTPKILTYDTSFVFDSRGTIARTEDETGPTLGVSLGLYGLTFSERGFTELAHSYARFLDNLVDRFGLFPVFIPNYVSGFQHDDLHFSRMIIKMMKKKHNVRLIEARNADELNMIIAGMSLVISSKMHPCAIALSNCIPTICIAYDHKQTGLFESLGLSEYVVLLTESSRERLLSVFSLLWHNRHQIREQLEVSVPMIRKDVDKEIRFALSVAYRDSKN